MENQKQIFYTDELNDEFSGIKRKPFFLDENFKYIHSNIFWKIAEFVVYRMIMTPAAYLYLKIKFRYKIVNKKVLKKYKNKGYFMYGNHTNIPADAYIPNMISFPKKCYVIVNSENIAVKGTRTFMSMVGAIPIPSSFKGMRNFIEAIEKRSVNHNAIAVYPEAHVWPYYTKIRPFKSTSFRYPVQFNDATFAYTTTYQKRKHSSKPKIVVYVDGPFYGENIDGTNSKENLRNKVYDCMVERAKNNNVEMIKYIKKAEDDL